MPPALPDVLASVLLHAPCGDQEQIPRVDLPIHLPAVDPPVPDRLLLAPRFVDAAVQDAAEIHDPRPADPSARGRRQWTSQWTSRWTSPWTSRWTSQWTSQWTSPGKTQSMASPMSWMRMKGTAPR